MCGTKRHAYVWHKGLGTKDFKTKDTEKVGVYWFSFRQRTQRKLVFIGSLSDRESWCLLVLFQTKDTEKVGVYWFSFRQRTQRKLVFIGSLSDRESWCLLVLFQTEKVGVYWFSFRQRKLVFIGSLSDKGLGFCQCSHLTLSQDLKTKHFEHKRPLHTHTHTHTLSLSLSLSLSL